MSLVSFTLIVENSIEIIAIFFLLYTRKRLYIVSAIFALLLQLGIDLISVHKNLTLNTIFAPLYATIISVIVVSPFVKRQNIPRNRRPSKKLAIAIAILLLFLLIILVMVSFLYINS